MDMRGTFDRRAMAALLQRLTQDGRPGTLRVRSGDRLRTILIRPHGMQVSSADDPEAHTLGERMVDRKLISPRDLAAAQRARAELGIPLEQALVQLGLLSKAVVEAALEEFVKDALDDLLTWEEGTFEFIAKGTGDKNEPSTEGVTVSVDIQRILLDAMRAQDEYEQVRRELPGPDDILVRPGQEGAAGLPAAAQPGAAGGAAAGAALGAPSGAGTIVLEETRGAVYREVDGRRGMREICERVRKSPIQLGPHFHALLTAGLIRVAGPAELRVTAQNCAREGNLEIAIRVYEHLIRACPDEVPLRLKMAKLYEGFGNPARSAHHHRAAASLLTAHGKFELAFDCLQRAVRHQPTDLDARVARMDLYVGHLDLLAGRRFHLVKEASSLLADLGAAGQNRRATDLVRRLRERFPQNAAMQELAARYLA
ncbi:MAG: DUF4388 domain-containing protein [Planctomycetes bacterium]|nr:DUF4388 domain-containing protein [Planctomycetota bacterium]